MTMATQGTFLLMACLLVAIAPTQAFSPMGNNKLAFVMNKPTYAATTANTFSYGTNRYTQLWSSNDGMEHKALPALKRVPADMEGVPIPFADKSLNEGGSNSGSVLKFIECYADSTCTINGVEYTIAVPCDYSVALCVASDEDPDQLIPIEVSDTEAMDDLFPIAESIVAEEFGEELVLQRTPQTLTLVGELDDEDDEEEYDDDDEEFDDENEEEDDEEEVDVLLSFEHRGKEYQLVRLLDPILLVGKNPEATDNELSMDMRVLLSPEESDAVMPILEEMFLKYHNEEYDE